MIKTVYLTNQKTLSFTEQELYFDYKKELWSILCEDGVSDDVLLEWYKDVLDSDGYIIRILDTLKTPEQVGFVFIATFKNCPFPYDYYIWDCYVEPEYRRRYIMWDVMQSFIKEHVGSYCMFLIDINVPAQSFWRKLFNSLDYVEHTEKVQDILEMEDKKTHFHGFVQSN